MVSYAIVYRHGLEKYVDDMQRAGIAGAIVPDLLVEESEQLAKICRTADFSLIQLVTPTTPRERAVRIAEASTGFIYYVSVTGITGERRDLPPELVDNVGWLREQTPLAGVHWLRHQHARSRAAAGAGGRWFDRRLSRRAPHCRSGEHAPYRGARRCGRVRVDAAGGVALAGVRRTPN